MLGKQLIDRLLRSLVQARLQILHTRRAKAARSRKGGARRVGYASPYFLLVDLLDTCFKFVYHSKLRRAAFVVLVVSLTSIWISDEPVNNLKDVASTLFNSAESIAIWAAAMLFFIEIPDRRKREHYEAWQLINSATGQAASGGRIAALEDLNKDSVDLSGLTAQKADLSGISLSYSKCSRADFTAAELDHSIFSRSDLSRSVLTGANLEGTSFIGANLDNANLDNANLRSARMNNAILRGASLIGANLQSAHFPDKKDRYRGVKIRSVDPGTVLSDADFTGANLSNAKLQRVSFSRVLLEGVNLENADLSSADLRTAKVTNSDLCGAILCCTKLPDNVDIDPCRDCHRTQFPLRAHERRQFDLDC